VTDSVTDLFGDDPDACPECGRIGRPIVGGEGYRCVTAGCDTDEYEYGEECTE